MKTLSRISLLFLIALAACNTQNTPITGECIRVTLIRNICGSAVFKIEDPSYFGLGENTDDEKNVFLGFIECSSEDVFSTVNDLTNGKQLYVELDPKDFNQECVVCLAMVNYTGKKQYKVRVHENCTTDPIGD